MHEFEIVIMCPDDTMMESRRDFMIRFAEDPVVEAISLLHSLISVCCPLKYEICEIDNIVLLIRGRCSHSKPPHVIALLA